MILNVENAHYITNIPDYMRLSVDGTLPGIRDSGSHRQVVCNPGRLDRLDKREIQHMVEEQERLSSGDDHPPAQRLKIAAIIDGVLQGHPGSILPGR